VLKRPTLVAASICAILLAMSAAPPVLGVRTAATGDRDQQSAEAVDRDSGDIVIAWNRRLLDIVLTPGAQPATIHPTRSFAMVSAAIYDAIVAIRQESPASIVRIDGLRGARPDAAAARAGHDILAALYPAMRDAVDQQLADELAAIPDGLRKRQGIHVGQRVAEAILRMRAHDGSGAVPPPFVPGSEPGDYRPTPPSFATPVFTHWANVTPFVLRAADQFRPVAPPPVSSHAYAAAINEVQSIGRDSSTTRTAQQTAIGTFWSGPIWNTWNEIAEGVARDEHLGLQRTARLFDALDLTLADGVIAFYDAKYHDQLWRPITAIREGDSDGNPETAGDPSWNPFVTTPPDPSYPGAHSVISGAAAMVLSAFVGDDRDLQVTSDVQPGTTRTFHSFSDVAIEAGLSRIYAGVHTRLDHTSGLALGQDIAHFVLTRDAFRDVAAGGR
jgi:hypothetical protein